MKCQNKPLNFYHFHLQKMNMVVRCDDRADSSDHLDFSYDEKNEQWTSDKLADGNKAGKCVVGLYWSRFKNLFVKNKK